MLVAGDPDHIAAEAWLKTNRSQLITTDYVMDETLTLLKARGQHKKAEAFGQALLDGALGTLHFLTVEEIRETWSVFLRFNDKDWSFTDCTSRVIIDRLAITSAFAFDHHFEQFGNVTVVPQSST